MNDHLSEVIEPLENVIKSKLIPSLTGRSAPSNIERNMLALPPKLDGLGIINPSSLCQEFTNSQMITALLSSLILQQDTDLKNVQEERNRLLSVVHQQKKSTMKSIAEQVEHEVPKAMKRSIDVAKEKCASTWLSVLSLIKHDFLLHKSAFRDALCFRYGWLPPRLADTCPCGKNSRLIMLLPVQLLDTQRSDTTKYAIL